MRLIVPKLKLGVDASSTAVLNSRRSISEAYLLIIGPGPQVTVGFMGVSVQLAPLNDVSYCVGHHLQLARLPACPPLPGPFCPLTWAAEKPHIWPSCGLPYSISRLDLSVISMEITSGPGPSTRPPPSLQCIGIPCSIALACSDSRALQRAATCTIGIPR